MHQILYTLHSYNRYIVMALLVFVLIRSLMGWLGKQTYGKLDNATGGALVGLTHLQVLIGLIMYAGTSVYTKMAFANMGAAMKQPWLRYFAVEHITAMLIAAVLIQMGRIFSKRAVTDEEKHKKMAIYVGIAALLIIGTLAMKGLLFSTMGELEPMSRQ